MKKLLFLSASLLLFCSADAQTDEKRWNVGFHGGLTQYNGDRGMNFYSLDQAAYGFGSVSVSRYLGRHLDLVFFATRGEAGNVKRDAAPNAANHFRTRMNTGHLAVRFNFLGPEMAVRPYIYAGGGFIVHEKMFTVREVRYDYALPSFGGGINFRFNDVVSVQLQESFMYTSSDNIDNSVHQYNDGFLFHTAGLTFNLGKKKDADMDGISDKKDKCPATPMNVVVDDDGCPLDKDKDGVADFEDECADIIGVASLRGCPDKDSDGYADKDDACPDVPGTAQLKGCPDRDSDGITDKDDRCPENAGSADMKGCPDSDGDRIADIEDKCPDTRAGYKVDLTGCPVDADKDGLVNEEDKCPDVFGALALKGCPDTDADGVADFEDRCPGSKGTVANKGCPEIAKVDVKKITSIASKIFFETGSDKLKTSSLAQLDILADILKRYNAAVLTIEGHTDNVGDDSFNQNLSQKRAQAVKDYLMTKGILESRLIAIGFGEAKPIADNNSSAGRTQNRRVELKTSY